MEAMDKNHIPAIKASLGNKGEDQKRFDTPIPRPTVPLGFRGIRHKRVEFDSRAPRQQQRNPSSVPEKA